MEYKTLPLLTHELVKSVYIMTMSNVQVQGVVMQFGQ